MAQLRAIAGDTGTGSDLHAFGTQFRLMDRPGEHSFDMDPQDLRGNDDAGPDRQAGRRLSGQQLPLASESVRLPGLFARSLSGGFRDQVRAHGDRPGRRYVRRAGRAHHQGRGDLQRQAHFLRPLELRVPVRHFAARQGLPSLHAARFAGLSARRRGGPGRCPSRWRSRGSRRPRCCARRRRRGG